MHITQDWAIQLAAAGPPCHEVTVSPFMVCHWGLSHCVHLHWTWEATSTYYITKFPRRRLSFPSFYLFIWQIISLHPFGLLYPCFGWQRKMLLSHTLINEGYFS